MLKTINKWLFGWMYLVELPNPKEELEITVKKGSTPDLPYFIMLGTSAIIATLGLLANSPAVIIGAMIIAPLMSPIIALSYWILKGELVLIFRSLLTILLGTILSMGVAYLIAELLGWKLAGSEIVARMNPNLLDLGVAIAAGTAAAFAYTRASVSAAFAGIAVAVALVPPLCSAGIALAVKDEVIGEVGLNIDRFDEQGPLLLFLTNLLGIVFAGCLVFYFQYFRLKVRAILILLLTMLGTGILVYPLGLSMNNLIVRNQIRRNLALITVSLLPDDYDKVRMRDLKVRFGNELIYIRANAVAQPGVISQPFIDRLQERLAESIKTPVILQVGIIEEPVMQGSLNIITPKEKKGLPK